MQYEKDQDHDDIDDSDFMFEDFDDYESVCDGCGRSEYDDGWCPLCCPNGGYFAPGTEDCD
jgi:hypothetical protein